MIKNQDLKPILSNSKIFSVWATREVHDISQELTKNKTLEEPNKWYQKINNLGERILEIISKVGKMHK